MVSGDKTPDAHTPMFQHRDWYKTVVYGALMCNVAGALSRQSHGESDRLSRAHIRSDQLYLTAVLFHHVVLLTSTSYAF